MTKQNFSLYSVLLMTVFIIASSCTKEEDNDNSNSNSFTDPRDGNTYQTVTIGTQVWMAENLKYLPSVAGPGTGSVTTPYYYVYDYDGTLIDDAKAKANYSTYGVLYNWPAAMGGAASSTVNSSVVQGVCPTGWHIPSEAEWTQLINYLGGDSVAGGPLKEIGTTHWESPNTGATNETGFTALPGGYRNEVGGFSNIGYHGCWWSATEMDSDYALYHVIYYDPSIFNCYSVSKENGYSIRCVKD